MTDEKSWLEQRIPFLFWDGVSSAAHSMVVFLPMLFLNAVTGVPYPATVWGTFWVYFYSDREDKDTAKYKNIKNVFLRKTKLRDSKLDRLFPYFTYLVGMMMTWL